MLVTLPINNTIDLLQEVIFTAMKDTFQFYRNLVRT